MARPVGINGKTFDHPVEAIRELEKLAAPYAIGRDIHVGDTIIGIKGRVGFEAAAPLIIIKAHHLPRKACPHEVAAILERAARQLVWNAAT